MMSGEGGGGGQCIFPDQVLRGLADYTSALLNFLPMNWTRPTHCCHNTYSYCVILAMMMMMLMVLMMVMKITTSNHIYGDKRIGVKWKSNTLGLLYCRAIDLDSKQPKTRMTTYIPDTLKCFKERQKKAHGCRLNKIFQSN